MQSLTEDVDFEDSYEDFLDWRSLNGFWRFCNLGESIEQANFMDSTLLTFYLQK